MPREQHNPDGSVTITLTYKDLQILELWGDMAVDHTLIDTPAEGFDEVEQALYDRISGLRTELEVNQGANS